MLNPNFHLDKDQRVSATQAEPGSEDTSSKVDGGEVSKDLDAGHALDTQDGTGSAEPPSSSESSVETSVITTIEDSSSSEEKPWDYCSVPASLCLNMNDPARANLKADPLVFGTGNNASYAVSDAPKWPEVTWLDLKGEEPVRSNKELEITSINWTEDDQLGFDAWVRHDSVSRDEVMISIEDMLALGRGSNQRIRCNAFSNAVLELTFKADWRSTSFQNQGAGQWQHVACFVKGQKLGIWYLGEVNESLDASNQVELAYINRRTQAKIILGSSDWLENDGKTPMTTSSADIAGIRIWNDVDTMIKVLNQEHQATTSP